MPKTRQQKEETIQQLTDKLKRAKSVVFADYKGLNMSQLSALRTALHQTEAEFTVTKNNLLKLALKNSPPAARSAGGLSIANSQLFQGPTATLFSYAEEVSPMKILVKALKDAGVGAIKMGLLDGQVMDNLQINRLAQLPSKDELRAKVVGSLGAPLYGIVGVLQGNLRNLVYVLDQIRQQKGGE